MKYTIAIEDLEYLIADYTNTINNMYDGDRLITDLEKEGAKIAIINCACAIEVLKNNED